MTDVGESQPTIKASAVDAYIPTTYFNGNIYEQRNMLVDKVYQIETGAGTLKTDAGVVMVLEWDSSYTDQFWRPDMRPEHREIAIYELADKVLEVYYGDQKCIQIYHDTRYNDTIGKVGEKCKYVGSGEKTLLSTFTSVYQYGNGWENKNDAEAGEYNKTKTSGDIIFSYSTKTVTVDGEDVEAVDKVFLFSAKDGAVLENKKIKILLELKGVHFSTVAGLNSFKDGNPDYKKSTIDAINGCKVSAVYDGRVFLTGNGELPNTVFYSQRNLTGANDPAYFGIYNYFNDGVGNTPNVDMLATPSFLMVIKKDTVQDGSVYYHVGQSNTDETYMDMLPRIYPSTSGAAGLGSAAGNRPSKLSCNFLDDPVFLSKRGLEAVGKEMVNLERTVQHRSSNVDRILIKEDLTRASLAEWKGYLVICCEGHMYLADSRYITPHPDGSYQYEWYYLEGLGTYEGYKPRWVFWMDFWPLIDPEGMTAYTLGDFLTLGGKAVREEYKLRDREDVPEETEIHTVTVVHPEDDSYTVPLYYAERDGVKYLVGWATEEKVGTGRFFGATKILTVGERLFFGTDNGDICVINTDMRGVNVGERVMEHDRIDRSFYSFNGVAYLSGCSTRLDDCDGKGVVKNTECGTTAIRFKMMPGSRARINVTLNGRDWHNLGEAYNSRFDFTDLQFSNFSFGENENNVVVIPELTRGWVQKQYYIYNDRFEEPFGIYELSYAYYVYGKIHY